MSFFVKFEHKMFQKLYNLPHCGCCTLVYMQRGKWLSVDNIDYSTWWLLRPYKPARSSFKKSRNCREERARNGIRYSPHFHLRPNTLVSIHSEYSHRCYSSTTAECNCALHVIIFFLFLTASHYEPRGTSKW